MRASTKEVPIMPVAPVMRMFLPESCSQGKVRLAIDWMEVVYVTGGGERMGPAENGRERGRLVGNG